MARVERPGGHGLKEPKRSARARRTGSGPRETPDFLVWREPIVARLREDERLFLEGVRHPQQEERRVARISREFLRGVRLLDNVEPAVTVFGSARFSSRHPWYRLAVEMGRRLAASGYTVVTGGGPGIMEAANRGARLAGGCSIGLNIQLPHEQVSNAYQDVSQTFRHFFARKVMFVKFASAYVVMPGGFGTLDELMEALTLVQTRMIRRMPIILVRRAYWAGLIDWLGGTLVREGKIDADDLDLIQLIDDPREVVRAIFDHYEKRGFEPSAREREAHLNL